MDHSILSPSGAHRWAECVGSLSRCEGYSEKTSEFAEEGVQAHEAADKWLREGVEPEDKTLRNELLPYIEYVKAEMDGAEFSWFEREVDLSGVLNVGGQKGTSDCSIVKGNELKVIDLKFGKGVVVDAENNYQLMLYALGVLEQVKILCDIETVWLVIVQPRLGHISEWSISVGDLVKKGEWFRYQGRIALSLMGKGVLRKFFNPGEKQCRFCPAKGECEALAEFNLKKISEEFEDLSGEMPMAAEVLAEGCKIENGLVENYDAERIAGLLPSLDLIKSWVEAVREAALNRALAGVKIPGYKLVAGRAGNRKWNNEDEVEEMMKAMRLKIDEMYNKKLISVTEAEKLLKSRPRLWSKLEGSIARSEGTPALAVESDKRPELAVSAKAEDFEDLGIDLTA